jgi:hypothetical protein
LATNILHSSASSAQAAAPNAATLPNQSVKTLDTAIDEIVPDETRDRLRAIRNYPFNKNGETLSVSDAIKDLRAIRNEGNGAGLPLNTKLIFVAKHLEEEILRKIPQQIIDNEDQLPKNLKITLGQKLSALNERIYTPGRLTESTRTALNREFEELEQRIRDCSTLSSEHKDQILAVLAQQKADIEEKYTLSQELEGLTRKIAVTDKFCLALAERNKIPLDKETSLAAFEDLLDTLMTESVDVNARVKLAMMRRDAVPDTYNEQSGSITSTGSNSLERVFDEILSDISKTIKENQEFNPQTFSAQLNEFREKILLSRNDTCSSIYSEASIACVKQDKLVTELLKMLKKDAISSLTTAMDDIIKGPWEESKLEQIKSNFRTLATEANVSDSDINTMEEILSVTGEIAKLKSQIDEAGLFDRNEQLQLLAVKLSDLSTTLEDLEPNSPIKTIGKSIRRQAANFHLETTALFEAKIDQQLEPYTSIQEEVGDTKNLLHKSVDDLQRALVELDRLAVAEKPEVLNESDHEVLIRKLLDLKAMVEHALMVKNLGHIGLLKGDVFTSEALLSKINMLGVSNDTKDELRAKVELFSKAAWEDLSPSLDNFRTLRLRDELDTGKLTAYAGRLNQCLANYEIEAKRQLVGPQLELALNKIAEIKSELNARMANFTLEQEFNEFYNDDPVGKKQAARDILMACDNNSLKDALLKQTQATRQLIQDIADYQTLIVSNPDITLSDQTLKVKYQDILKRLYDICLASPGLQNTALKVAKSILGDKISDVEINSYHEARVINYNLFHIMNRTKSGAQLLKHLEVKVPEDLTFETRKKILDNLDPNKFANSSFNILLAKSLWNDYNVGLRDNPEGQKTLMRQFINFFPNLKVNFTVEELFGNFAQGQFSSTDLATRGFLFQDATSLFFVNQEMEKVTDKFLASDPKFAARHARDVALRRVANSMTVTYDPQKLAVDQMKALATNLRERANALAQEDHSSIRQRTKAATLADQWDQAATAPNYASNLQTYQNLRSQLLEVAKTDRDLIESLDKISQIPDEDLQKYGTLPTNDPDRTEALKHLTLFLHYQGAYRPPEGVIANKVSGETMALRLAAFSATLDGSIKLPGFSDPATDDGLVKVAMRDMTPQEQVAALKGVTVPKYFNLSQMKSSDSVFGRVSSDAEGQQLLDVMNKLKSLDPNAADFATEFQRLKDEYEKIVTDYRLNEKADIILSFRSTSAANQQTPLEFAPGRSLSSKVKLIRSDKALRDGLQKMWGGRRTSQAKMGNLEAKALDEHLFKSKVTVRGSGVNARVGRELNTAQTRYQLLTQRALLEEAEANYSRQIREFMDNLTTVAIFSAFEELKINNFQEAAAQIKTADDPSQSEIYIKAFQILHDACGLTEDQAHHALRLRLVNPIKISGGDGAEVFEALYDNATPSKANRQQLENLTSEQRLAYQARETRLRNEAILDRLNPGEIIDYSSDTTVKAGAKVPVVTGVKVSASVQIASQNGLAISQSTDGAYSVTMAHGRGVRVGVGAEVDALLGHIGGNVGVSGSRTKGITLNFESREKCLQFLDGIATNYSRDLVAQTASEIQIIRENEIGLEIQVEVVAELPGIGNEYITDDFEETIKPMLGGGNVGFTVAAGASVARQSRTERTATTESVTESWTGSVGVSASVEISTPNLPGIGESVNAYVPTAPLGKLPETYQDQLGALEDADQGPPSQGLEVGKDVSIEDGTATANFSGPMGGKDRRVIGSLGTEVGMDFDPATLTASVHASASASLSASTTATVQSSTVDGSLIGATKGLTVNFTGNRSVEQFRNFLTNNLQLPPEQVKKMVSFIEDQITAGEISPNFSVETQHTLKQSFVDEANNPNLEPKERAKAAKRATNNSDGYELTGIHLSCERASEGDSSNFINIIRHDRAINSRVEYDLIARRDAKESI